MLDRLVAAAPGEVSAVELADAVWLARFLPAAGDLTATPAGDTPANDGTPEPPPVPQTDGEPEDRVPADEPRTRGRPQADLVLQGAQARGPTLRVPSAPALRNRRALQRALRPLRRSADTSSRWMVIDPEASAHRTAETDLLTIVFRPAPARWLDLALVFDDSDSMVIWHSVSNELQELLARQGAFRDIRRWHLVSRRDDGGPPRLALTGSRRDIRVHSPDEIVDPTGRRLVMVFSDCVGEAWSSGAMAPILERWGRSGPVVIVQPLPQTMWSRCAVPFTPIELQSVAPGLPNSRLRVSRPAPALIDEGGDGVPVPVIELAPRWVEQWAAMVAGTAFGPVRGMGLLTGDGVAPAEEAQTPPADPVDRVFAFRTTASPAAFRLAAHLAAAAPLTLPVMRLIQAAAVPDSDHRQFAELFLSGLLRRVTLAEAPVEPDDIQYDFMPGLRELLISTLTRQQALDVLRRVSDFLTRRFGQPVDFTAVLADAETTLSPTVRPFASVAVTVLDQLGGPYAEQAALLRRTLGGAAVDVPATPSMPAGEVAEGGEEPAFWFRLGAAPRPTGRLVGTDVRVERVRAMLTGDGPSRPCVLAGPGGSGTSTVAAAYARRYADDYEIVWWIPADRPERIRAALAGLGRELGLPVPERVPGLPVLPGWASQTVAALSDGEPVRRWLLVFDGLDPGTDLTPYLPAGGHTIVTTRDGDLDPERTVPVDLEAAERRELGPEWAETAERFQPAGLRVLQAWRATAGSPLDPDTVAAVGAADDPMPAACRQLLAELPPETAAALLRCAFAGSSPVPVPLVGAAGDLAATGLVDRGDGEVWLSPAIREGVRAAASAAQARAACDAVHLALSGVDPGPPDDPRTWAAYAGLTPLIFGAAAAESAEPAVSRLVLRVIDFLDEAGERGIARALRTARHRGSG
ncbi:SAV_2336 N-terminal domain-related protein [Actinoplanes sp. NPDC049118]|uniref:SAV_2336 N-terminal domain-related protein n=1 Tax=Actinoplanes sp. NPDC049118 TaxID=3155769 RepID=UPI0034080ACE